MCQQQRGGGVVGVVVVYWRLISSPLFKTGCFWRSAFRDVCSLIWRRTGSRWGPARQERAEPFPRDASHQKRGRLQARSPWLKVDKGGRTGYWGSTLAWRPRFFPGSGRGATFRPGGDTGVGSTSLLAAAAASARDGNSMRQEIKGSCVPAAEVLVEPPPPLPKRCRPGSPAALSWTLMAG